MLKVSVFAHFRSKTSEKRVEYAFSSNDEKFTIIRIIKITSAFITKLYAMIILKMFFAAGPK